MAERYDITVMFDGFDDDEDREDRLGSPAWAEWVVQIDGREVYRYREDNPHIHGNYTFDQDGCRSALDAFTARLREVLSG